MSDQQIEGQLELFDGRVFSELPEDRHHAFVDLRERLINRSPQDFVALTSWNSEDEDGYRDSN